MAWGHSYSSEGGKNQLDPECIVKKVQTKIAGISNMGVKEVKMSLYLKTNPLFNDAADLLSADAEKGVRLLVGNIASVHISLL